MNYKILLLLICVDLFALIVTIYEYYLRKDTYGVIRTFHNETYGKALLLLIISVGITICYLVFTFKT